MTKYIEFLAQCKKELKKVRWPSKPTVVETSVIVFVCMVIFSTYLWLIDLGLGQVFAFLLYR